MEDTLTLMRLREEISRSLGNYYIDELRVLSDDYFIKIEGNFSSIDKVYTFLVKGDLLLNRENAERFLKSLTQMSIRNQGRGYSEIKLVVSDMGKIVFAKDNKELSWGDLDNNFEDAQFASRLASLTSLSAKYKTDRFTAVATLLGTVVKEKVEVGEKAPDKQRLSPSVSLSYRLLKNENLRLRFSYKDAFRLPTFNDLYYDWHGTPSLRPEKAQQFNLGLTWSGRFGSVVRYMSLTADAYYNKVKDKIVAYPTMFIWKMENMGTVDIKGTDINLFADLRLTDKLSLLVSGSYTFQKAVDVTDESDKNYKDQIPYTPRHSGSGSVSFENPWVNITYSLVGAGERYINPQNTEKNRIEPYVEQSLSANRTFRFGNTSFRLQVEVINLADKQYDIIKYYPMPGRSYRVSLVFDY